MTVTIPAWIYLIVIVATGIAAHLAARGRSAGHDCGGFWAQIVERLSIWAGIPFLLASCLHTLPPLKAALTLVTPTYWLLIIGGTWALLLALGLAGNAAPESGRWLAGTLEFSPYRFWVLLFFMPFVPALIYSAPPWQEEVYAGHWALLAAFLAALGFLALSASPAYAQAVTAQAADPPAHVALSPWPDEMTTRGIALTQVASWTPGPDAEPCTGISAEWQRRLAAAGSQGASGLLCDAVSGLIAPEPGRGEPVAIVLGPDHCGQEEVTALGATELSRLYGESTLVITAASDQALAERLGLWLNRTGGETPAQLLHWTAAARPGDSVQADLILTDVETLSETVMDRLRGELDRRTDPTTHSGGLGRVGLVVWWNAHEFSGVLAANVWAVSRRLQRLLDTGRGLPARALVYSRLPRVRGEAFAGFLEYLLPFDRNRVKQFQIQPEFARRTHLYAMGDRSPGAARRATEASVLTDWPTLPPRGADTAALARPPAESAASAGARILEIRPEEVLSIPEMICQGGRSSLPGLDHHVAVASSDNPYVNFLVSRLSETDDASASAHLIGAEGHPDLVRRHLLLALREVPDTLTGLRQGFRWEEKMLKSALLRLSHENRLSRVPVRFLDHTGRLQRDSRYANQNPGQGAIRSFRMIGRSNPVELRDPDAKNRLLLQVDPERLPIEAYPMRVFESDGRRYRVQEWKSAAPRRIDCYLEETDIRTWPYSHGWITGIRPSSGFLGIRGAKFYTARVQYNEDVWAILERDTMGILHGPIKTSTVRTKFETEALIVDFTERFSLDQLVGAAGILQQVLPVHTAVEENALRVVPVQEANAAGLALVDLYPGGIGTASAIHKSKWLLPALFDQIVFWLSRQGRGDTAGEISKSPLLKTRNIEKLDTEGVLRVFTSAAMQAR